MLLCSVNGFPRFPHTSQHILIITFELNDLACLLFSFSYVLHGGLKNVYYFISFAFFNAVFIVQIKHN